MLLADGVPEREGKVGSAAAMMDSHGLKHERKMIKYY